MRQLAVFGSVARVGCVLALVAGNAFAYRPFDGTDADVAATGALELEIGPLEVTRLANQTAYTPSLTINYGFSHRFEVVLDLDTDAVTRPLRSDLLVKGIVRQGSLQGGTGPSVAIETGVLFPTLPRDDSDPGWLASVIVSQMWAPLAVHLTLTGAYDRERQIAAQASVILEGPDVWTIRPVGELLVARDRESALGGAIWQRDTRNAFDLALVVEHDDGANGVQVRLGWTLVL